MTVDKYIAIKWPHKAVPYSTPERAKFTTMALFICTIVYNIPLIFWIKIVESRCVPYSTANFFGKLHSWLSFVLNAIIPFTMLISMNCIIVKEVRKSRKMFAMKKSTTASDRSQSVNRQSGQKSKKSVENQLTIMLLLVTTLFLVLLSPSYVQSIYQTLTERDTPSKYANSMLFLETSFSLLNINSAINFFLYCISGQKFRNDLKEILCFVRGGGRPSTRKTRSHATTLSIIS